MPQYVESQPVRARTEQHLDAVTHSLALAQESADRGDYADAIGWLQAVEATGDRLSAAHQTKHRAWQAALAHGQAMHKPRGAQINEA